MDMYTIIGSNEPSKPKRGRKPGSKLVYKNTERTRKAVEYLMKLVPKHPDTKRAVNKLFKYYNLNKKK